MKKLLALTLKYVAPSLAIFVAGYFCGLYRDAKKEIKQVEANHAAVLDTKEKQEIKADKAVSYFVAEKDRINKIKERVVYVQQTKKSSSACVVSDSIIRLHNEAATGDN